MIKLDESTYIDVEHVEAVYVDTNVWFVRTASGQVFSVSPSMAKTIIEAKKSNESAYTQRFVG